MRAVNRTVMYIIHVLSFAVYKAMNLAVVEDEKMQNPSVIDIFSYLFFVQFSRNFIVISLKLFRF